MNTISAIHKLKYLILATGDRFNGLEQRSMDGLSEDDIDQAYVALIENDEHRDLEQEVRGGDVETGIKCDWSRHYESKSVASKLPDGSWVGWTYWYGGGKHGEPEAIDWIPDAYDIECSEEEKLVVVRTFTKRPTP